MKITKPTNRHIRIIIIAVIVLVIAAGATAFALYQNSNNTANQAKSNNNKQSSGNTSSQNAQPAKDKTNDMPTSASQNNTSIVVVDASQYSDVFEVRSYVTTIADGTCTFVFTRGSNTLTKTSKASAGPSSTTCSTIDVPVNEFNAKGSWNLSISYKSSDNQYATDKQLSIEVK